MAASIVQTIAARYDSFTPSFKKVADYLCEHPHESQFLSIGDLADACGVGKATISRFCAALGFDGYSRFRLALARSPESVAPQDLPATAAAATGPDGPADGPVEPADGVASTGAEPAFLPPAQRAPRLLAANTAVMSQTLALMDFAAVERAARILVDASSVWCLGHGGSGTIASDAWGYFLTLSPKFHWVADSHFQIMSASLGCERSAILFCSYLGNTKDAADVLAPARERGAKVILVTRHALAPAADFADEVLVCGGRETPLEGGSIIAKISMLFAIDLLAGEYARLAGDEAIANRDATTEALAARML